MSKRLFPIFILLFLSIIGYSQLSVVNNSLLYKDEKGKLDFKLFANNILKVTFTPIGYLHNEQISDAVMIKPANASPVLDKDKKTAHWGDMVIQIKNGRLVFGKKEKCILTDWFSRNDNSGFKFQLDASEKIYGTGERAIPLDRRGYDLPLYNEPHGWYGVGQTIMNYHIPLVTSSKYYTLFFDNPAKGYFDIGKKEKGVLEYGVCSGEINFYLIEGKNYAELLQSYHQLTGLQPLPPRWAMGNFMSRFGYTSEKETREIFDKMKKDGIPFDAVIFDLFWFGDSIKGGLGNLDWMNKKAWPDPKNMIADFKKQGVKTILITEPFILEKTKYYDSLQPYLAVDSAGNTFRLTDFYFGYGGLLDIFRKDAQNAFWKSYDRQMKIGVEGWWGDLGEPEKHPAGIYHNLKDFGYKRLFKADEVHNIYGHYWTKMLFTNYEKYYPEKRLFSLNRSGYAGSQRYGIFPWSGDVARTWSGYQAQLPIMLGMSMCGIPYIHSDAGGFTGGDKDQELYVRWMQFSSFSPVLRPHAFALYGIDPNSTSFPSEAALMDKPYKEFAKACIVNRYHRLPYHYTLCYNQTNNGEPLVSPLYFYFNNDTLANRVEDAFMYGENLLVAPVLEKNASSRSVYLPNGYWYEWNNNAIIKGGQSHTTAVTLDHIPVYVKAGSFIPTIPDSIELTTTASYSTQELDWHYYMGSDSSAFTLFDDDGESKHSIEQNQYELITASSNGWYRNKQITFSSNRGNFTGKPAKRNFHLIIHGLYDDTYIPIFYINGKSELAVKKADGSFQLNFPFEGNETIVRIQQTLIKQ